MTPAAHVRKIRAARRAKILDVAAPRMILVESSTTDIATLMDELPGWTVSPERTIKIPDPRPKPGRGPSVV